MLDYLTENTTAIFINICVAAVFFYLGLRGAPPKIISRGGSGSRQLPPPNNDTHVAHLHVENLATVYGRKISRQTAHELHAKLWDIEAKKMVGVLLWQTDNSSNSDFGNMCDLVSGTSKTLCIFAKKPDSDFYSLPSKIGGVLQFSPTAKKFYTDNKKFRIKFRDSINRETSIDIYVNNYHSQLNVRIVKTWRVRLDDIAGSFMDLLRAFK